jgi:hypothetical protein
MAKHLCRPTEAIGAHLALGGFPPPPLPLTWPSPALETLPLSWPVSSESKCPKVLKAESLPTQFWLECNQKKKKERKKEKEGEFLLPLHNGPLNKLKCLCGLDCGIAELQHPS